MAWSICPPARFKIAAVLPGSPVTKATVSCMAPAKSRPANTQLDSGVAEIEPDAPDLIIEAISDGDNCFVDAFSS